MIYSYDAKPAQSTAVTQKVDIVVSSVYPLKTHFNSVKLGFTGVYLFFLFLI